jgi:SagB-type dehydrogenase family enzyme
MSEAATASAGHTLRLRPGARLTDDGALVYGMARLGLRDRSEFTISAMEALAGDGLDADGLTGSPQLGMLVHQLESGGWIARTVRAGDRPLATLEPLGFADVLVRKGLGPDLPLRTSRFALLHALDGQTIVESGHAKARVVLHEPLIAGLIAGLSAPVAEDDLDPAEYGLERDELDAVIRLLLQARILVRDSADEPERSDQTLAQWDPVDLLFHARSRLGRRGEGYGGTYRFKDRFSDVPALREQPEEALALPKPDLDRLMADDPPLQKVIEERKSVRMHDDGAPIDIARLGELLYRTSRVKGTIDHPEQGTFALRPYPNGGALYELEVYPVVRLCEGVPAGLHRYDGVRHALVPISEPSAFTEGLLQHSRVAALMESPPQVLLVIAARFDRVSWKYEGMPYALTLKHVGVLYQTLYLAATAMGLAPCGLGGGDSDLFSRAAGVAYEAETSVGEFILGSRPAEGTGPGIAEIAEPTPEF